MDTLTYIFIRCQTTKIFAQEEKLGGMSKDEMASIQNVGMQFSTM